MQNVNWELGNVIGTYRYVMWCREIVNNNFSCHVWKRRDYV